MTLKNLYFFSFLILLCTSKTLIPNVITPYKFTDAELKRNQLSYKVPSSARHIIKQLGADDSYLVYYLSKPDKDSYPITFLCSGSSSAQSITSSIHFHRYFLQELLDLNSGVITIEQCGVNGNIIDTQKFMNYYTRTQRLNDHKNVIDYLIKNRPTGWNGKLIFIGVSEGGPIVLKLTETYASRTIATISWSGTGDFLWEEELWAFIQDLRNNGPWWLRLWDKIPTSFPFSLDIPKNRKQFDIIVARIISNPTAEKQFMGMTYKYLSDAFTFPQTNYSNLITPLLVVTGSRDSIVASSDSFVENAQASHCPITYFRINDMDHYIRKRPDIIKQSFDWLKKQISALNS